jgi:uncharacterized protein (TIGR02145 family)
MAENLKTTTLNDGTLIPNVTDGSTWIGLTTLAYCWYDNDNINKNVYGALYNGFAVGTGKLCPAGWHMPTDDEWTVLTDYLGSSTAGQKLKETGTTHWKSPNYEATNESGFTALPGGGRHFNMGTFFYIGINGVWWSSSEGIPQKSNSYKDSLSYSSESTFIYFWTRLIDYLQPYVTKSCIERKSGFSVRCLKD